MDPKGSWKTMGMRPRTRRLTRLPCFSPSKTMVPELGGYRPANTRAMVDLPDPDSPTRATISLGATSKVTSSLACRMPAERNPPTRK